jgi:phosphoglycolate phosphatase
MVKALAEQAHQIELQDGIATLLHQLYAQGIPFGVISSNAVNVIEAVFENSKLPEPLFIGSSSALFKKHKVFKKLCKQHQLPVKSGVYVGDETRDLSMGEKLEIPVLSFSWGFGTEEALLKAGANNLCRNVNQLSEKLSAFTHFDPNLIA